MSTTRPLEVLHLDPFGPIRTVCLGGKKYGLVIVDDFLRFTWVIFLVHKDETLRLSKYFVKEIKMKKVFIFHPSDKIMVVNLKIMFLKIFTLKMAFLTIFLLLELLNKMELLKGRINFCKK